MVRFSLTTVTVVTVGSETVNVAEIFFALSEALGEAKR
jgi:hypothetical protein